LNPRREKRSYYETLQIIPPQKKIYIKKKKMKQRRRRKEKKEEGNALKPKRERQFQMDLVSGCNFARS